MKRYRVLMLEFDARANYLAIEIQRQWDAKIQSVHHANKDKIAGFLREEFGTLEFDRKIEDFMAIGPRPVSILAFHNRFQMQVRNAFVAGAYYAALAGACALGERILNHLMLSLREDYRTSPQYKEVYSKRSFENWKRTIGVLEQWNVLLPEVGASFRALEKMRHRVVHFDPAVDFEDRAMALEAILCVSRIVAGQFAAFGEHPWFIPGIHGAGFIRKEAEDLPFVRRIYLPKCERVGPRHTLQYDGTRVVVHDAEDYPDIEISDEEFTRLLEGGS